MKLLIIENHPIHNRERNSFSLNFVMVSNFSVSLFFNLLSTRIAMRPWACIISYTWSCLIQYRNKGALTLSITTLSVTIKCAIQHTNTQHNGT